VTRPGRRHPNLILGGHGGPRLVALVARYADELNISSESPAEVAKGYERLRAACVTAGRDPGTVTRSAMTGLLVGHDAAEVNRRVATLMAGFGQSGSAEDWLAERRARWIIGTADEARARINEFEAAGVERLMLQTFLPRDLAMVRFMGEVLGLRP
jgi:alkanesulfonate monooxygenase SsuD/methylene tetrahydromethanopterin reductase-like flavin-dependent oxidoreductase (luciferase family)